MEQLDLERPVLFLEFFARSVKLHHQSEATQLTPHSLFYLGKSLSTRSSNGKQLIKGKRKWTEVDPIFGYRANRPCLLNQRVAIRQFIEHIQDKSLLNTIWVEGGETPGMEIWHRYEERIQFSYAHSDSQLSSHIGVGNKAPYHFPIQSVSAEGIVETRFPRYEIPYQLEVNQTYAFLCRKGAYQSGEWFTPGECLVLFVKNYGFHSAIQLISQEEINSYDPAHICEEKDLKIRDHRKSRLKYELG